MKEMSGKIPKTGKFNINNNRKKTRKKNKRREKALTTTTIRPRTRRTPSGRERSNSLKGKRQKKKQPERKNRILWDLLECEARIEC